MFLVWIKFFATASDPELATPQDRARFGRMATVIAAFGAVFLLLAAGFFTIGILDKQSYGAEPQSEISADTITGDDLQGRLAEARVHGVLHLDRMLVAQIDSGSPRTLIPLTHSGWTDVDPITVYVQTHLFIYDQILTNVGDPFHNVSLGHLELPANTQGPTPVSILVKSPVNPATNAPDGALLLEYVRPQWRADKIDRKTSGSTMLVGIFGAMGGVIALIGVWARRSIRSVSQGALS